MNRPLIRPGGQIRQALRDSQPLIYHPVYQIAASSQSLRHGSSDIGLPLRAALCYLPLGTSADSPFSQALPASKFCYLILGSRAGAG